MTDYKNLKEKQQPRADGIFEEDDNEDKLFKDKAVTPRTSSYNWARCIIIGVVVILAAVAFYFFFYRNGLFNRAIINLQTGLRGMYRDKPALFMLVVYLIMNGIIAACLGFHTLFCILTASIIQNFWISFPMLLFSSVSGDFLAYLISTFTCKSWLMSKFSSNDLYNVLAEESTKEPYKTAFLTRFIFMPAGVKNYILSLIQNPLPSYFLSGLTLHSFYVAESCLIAKEISEISSIVGKKKGWDEKSAVEKFSFIVVLLLIVFTVVFIVFVGIWATRKIKEKRQSRELEMQDYKN